MPAQKLTEAVISRLPAPDKTRDIRDAHSTGLYLRVQPTGRKAWRMRYKYRDKPRVMVLGEWPAMKLTAARKAVLDHHETLSSGSDPAGDVQRAKSIRKTMPTVAEFADEYIERHAKPNKKTWAKDHRVLEKDVTPHIGKMLLTEVHRRDIVGVLDRVKDRGVTTHANRVYAVIRKMFNFAVERGVLDMSPAQQIKLTKETRRDAVLTDEAIAQLWAATDPYGESETALPMHHTTRLVLRLLLLTGARNGEVCGIALSEIDPDRKLWTLPANRAKNGNSYTIPLSDTALDTIEAALETADDTYLFPSNSAAGHTTNYAPIQAMQRLFDHEYRPHDLRRTAATRISELGFNRLVVDKVLNHVDSSVGGIYDRHSYDNEKRGALNAWASALDSIVTGEKRDKVVNMPRNGGKIRKLKG
jgi:integrase